MSLSRHPTINGLWVARIYPEGRKKDPRTGKPSNYRETYLFEGDEASAQNWYVNLVRSGPRKAAPIAPTIDQAYPDFCVYYRSECAPGTYKDFLLTWRRHLKQYFGAYKPQLLTPAVFDAYKDYRAAQTYLPSKRSQRPEDDSQEEAASRRQVTRRTVQKEINYIRSMLKWMVANNKCLPLGWKINNYKASQTTSPEKVIPSRAEMIRILRSCRGSYDRQYRAAMATAYYAGLRATELLTLDARNLDLKNWYILVRGKGGKNRTVPITRKLRPYVRNLPKIGLCFYNPETTQRWYDLGKPLKRTCTAAGVPAISLHTFRHAFAVHALQRGVSLRTLQLVMGHSSIKTTERYLHLVPDDLAADLEHGHKRSAPLRQGKIAGRSGG